MRGTAKNDRSSRSHAVFTLELTRTTTRGAATVTQASRLHLVDLAGSERVKEAKTTGDGVKEVPPAASRLSSGIDRSLTYARRRPEISTSR